MVEMFPPQSVVLGALKLRLYQTIVVIQHKTQPLRTLQDIDKFAAATANMSDQLAANGRDQRALQGTQFAASYYGTLAEHCPDLFRPAQARVLATLAHRLTKAGQAKSAAVAIDRALEIAEGLATEDPAEHEPLLVRTLSAFAHSFPLSRTCDSLTAMRRAVNICERRAIEQPDQPEVQATLARALNDLVPLCIAAAQAVPRIDEATTAARMDEATAATRSAVDIYERLTTENRDVHQPELVTSLHNLTGCYLQQRRLEQALDNAEEMAVILSDLADHAPTRFGELIESAIYVLEYFRKLIFTHIV